MASEFDAEAKELIAESKSAAASESVALSESGTVVKKNLNSADAKGHFVLYEIDDGGVKLKIGKANADDVMADGSIRRAWTSARLARKAGYKNANATIIEDLGETTAAEATNAEAARVRAERAKGNELPLNKEKNKRYYNP